jgi:hypothetical protein
MVFIGYVLSLAAAGHSRKNGSLDHSIFYNWLIQVGSGLHYCFFDLWQEPIFDKNTIKQA